MAVKRAGSGNFNELQSGIQRVGRFIFSEKLHIEKAIIHASKAAWPASLLKSNSTTIKKYSDPAAKAEFQHPITQNSPVMSIKTQDPVKRALLISLFVSAISLSIKIGAFFVTGSVGALADSAESVVHFFAVIFVVYGYYLSLKPADDDHHYGHERIEFLSVGAEGAIIIAAGIIIIYHAVKSVIFGVEIGNLDTGIPMLIVAALINLVLGLYLVRTGKKYDSMLAISNGKHTLTDVWTSAGVVISLLLISFTGWLFIDIIVSVTIAAFIGSEAYKLLRYSISGIMDTRDEEVDAALKMVEVCVPTLPTINLLSSRTGTASKSVFVIR